MNMYELKLLADLVADKLEKKKDVKVLSEPEYVNTNEAARILGVSPNYLRIVKDKYPHIKTGEHKQARIMFRRDALLNVFVNNNKDIER